MKVTKIAGFGKEKIQSNKENSLNTEKKSLNNDIKDGFFSFKLPLYITPSKPISLTVPRAHVAVIGHREQIQTFTKFFLDECPSSVHLVCGKSFDEKIHKEIPGQNTRLILADIEKTPFRKIKEIIDSCSLKFIFKPVHSNLIESRFLEKILTRISIWENVCKYRLVRMQHMQFLTIKGQYVGVCRMR